MLFRFAHLLPIRNLFGGMLILLNLALTGTLRVFILSVPFRHAVPIRESNR